MDFNEYVFQYEVDQQKQRLDRLICTAENDKKRQRNKRIWHKWRMVLVRGRKS